MEPEELFRAAEQRANHRELLEPPNDSVLERLRSDASAFFAKVPEPPLYPRLDDPERRRAAELLSEGELLLARALTLSRAAKEPARLGGLVAGLRAYLACLCHTADGRLDAAEREWLVARRAERELASATRIFTRSDEVRRPVYDRAAGTSRYDPSPEPELTVTLACPERGCRVQQRFKLSPRYATHQLRCPRCARPFVAYLAHVRSVSTRRKGLLALHRFSLEELGGGRSQVEVEDRSGAEFGVARQDLLAFLYDEDRDLNAVLNLSTGRLLDPQRALGCFVATAALGPGAPELAVFRAFRDRALLGHPVGRSLVGAYYAIGPRAAQWISGRPNARRLARTLLGRLSRVLQARGYR
jgi:hypothetical protein